MRKTRASPLWNYLNERGVLERGDAAEIRQAKEEYRSQYMKNYKYSYKRKKKDFAITCTAQEQEQVEALAKMHGLKPSTFLKKAVFAYCNHTYIVPQVSVMHSILQLLLRYETIIARVGERDKGAWYKTDRNYEKLEEAVEAMRNGVQNEFTNPPRLETVICQTLRQKPEYLKTIQTILREHDSEKHGA